MMAVTRIAGTTIPISTSENTPVSFNADEKAHQSIQVLKNTIKQELILLFYKEMKKITKETPLSLQDAFNISRFMLEDMYAETAVTMYKIYNNVDAKELAFLWLKRAYDLEHLHANWYLALHFKTLKNYPEAIGHLTKATNIYHNANRLKDYLECRSEFVLFAHSLFSTVESDQQIAILATFELLDIFQVLCLSDQYDPLKKPTELESLFISIHDISQLKKIDKKRLGLTLTKLTRFFKIPKIIKLVEEANISSDQMYALGDMYFNENDPSCFQWFMKSMLIDSNALAHLKIAICHLSGLGVAVDPEAAVNKIKMVFNMQDSRMQKTCIQMLERFFANHENEIKETSVANQRAAYKAALTLYYVYKSMTDQPSAREIGAKYLLHSVRILNKLGATTKEQKELLDDALDNSIDYGHKDALHHLYGWNSEDKANPYLAWTLLKSLAESTATLKDILFQIIAAREHLFAMEAALKIVAFKKADEVQAFILHAINHCRSACVCLEKANININLLIETLRVLYESVFAFAHAKGFNEFAHLVFDCYKKTSDVPNKLVLLTLLNRIKDDLIAKNSEFDPSKVAICHYLAECNLTSSKVVEYRGQEYYYTHKGTERIAAQIKLACAQEANADTLDDAVQNYTEALRTCNQITQIQNILDGYQRMWQAALGTKRQALIDESFVALYSRKKEECKTEDTHALSSSEIEKFLLEYTKRWLKNRNHFPPSSQIFIQQILPRILALCPNDIEFLYLARKCHDKDIKTICYELLAENDPNCIKLLLSKTKKNPTSYYESGINKWLATPHDMSKLSSKTLKYILKEKYTRNNPIAERVANKFEFINRTAPEIDILNSIHTFVLTPPVTAEEQKLLEEIKTFPEHIIEAQTKDKIPLAGAAEKMGILYFKRNAEKARHYFLQGAKLPASLFTYRCIINEALLAPGDVPIEIMPLVTAYEKCLAEDNKDNYNYINGLNNLIEMLKEQSFSSKQHELNVKKELLHAVIIKIKYHLLVAHSPTHILSAIKAVLTLEISFIKLNELLSGLLIDENPLKTEFYTQLNQLNKIIQVSQASFPSNNAEILSKWKAIILPFYIKDKLKAQSAIETALAFTHQEDIKIVKMILTHLLGFSLTLPDLHVAIAKCYSVLILKDPHAILSIVELNTLNILNDTAHTSDSKSEKKTEKTEKILPKPYLEMMDEWIKLYGDFSKIKLAGMIKILHATLLHLDHPCIIHFEKKLLAFLVSLVELNKNQEAYQALKIHYQEKIEVFHLKNITLAQVGREELNVLLMRQFFKASIETRTRAEYKIALGSYKKELVAFKAIEPLNKVCAYRLGDKAELIKQARQDDLLSLFYLARTLSAQPSKDTLAETCIYLSIHVLLHLLKDRQEIPSYFSAPLLQIIELEAKAILEMRKNHYHNLIQAVLANDRMDTLFKWYQDLKMQNSRINLVTLVSCFFSEEETSLFALYRSGMREAFTMKGILKSHVLDIDDINSHHISAWRKWHIARLQTLSSSSAHATLTPQLSLTPPMPEPSAPPAPSLEISASERDTPLVSPVYPKLSSTNSESKEAKESPHRSLSLFTSSAMTMASQTQSTHMPTPLKDHTLATGTRMLWNGKNWILEES